MKCVIFTHPDYSTITVAGKPILEYQLKFLREQGIRQVLLLVREPTEKIKNYFGSGLRWDMDLSYIDEELLHHNARALKKAERHLNERFMVLRGDVYAQFSLSDLLSFHEEKKSTVTKGMIRSSASNNNLSARDSGIYVIEPVIFNKIQNELVLESEVFSKLHLEGTLAEFHTSGYVANFSQADALPIFKKDVIESLILLETSTVLDALAKINRSEINLVLVVDRQHRLKGILTDRLIRRFLLGGGSLQGNILSAIITNPTVARDTDDVKKIENLLFSGINSLPILDAEGRVVNVAFRSENFEDATYPILRGRAPLRISFAGGGTDLPYFFEKYGGAVVSATIDKYCYATLVKRADKKIILSTDLLPDHEEFIESIDHIQYNGEYDLLKAVIRILRPNFGFELYLHNDIPPRRGLGSSASAAVLIASLLTAMMGLTYNDHKLAEIAYRAEREELKIKGGWQDQYASATGGFNYMEFNADKTIVYPLRLKKEVIHELQSHLLLCYVGKSHVSADVHESQEQTFKRNEEETVTLLTRLKGLAIEIRDALLTDQIALFGDLLHESWQLKRGLDKNISSSHIDQLYAIGLQNGARGGKLLGAGNGGYILFFYEPKRRNALTKALEEAGGKVLNFNFESHGTKVWSAREKK